MTMSNEIGELLAANKVRVCGTSGEPYRLCGLDVIHDEVQITVRPAKELWSVVSVGGKLAHTYAAKTIADALALATLARGEVLVAWEVAAPDAESARVSYLKGKRLFQFAWLGT